MASEPMTAAERVELKTRNSKSGFHELWLDGKNVTRFFFNSDTGSEDMLVKAINTTVEMCCAEMCPHCANGVPIEYAQEAIYHPHEDGDLLCKAVAIRRVLGEPK